MQVFYFSPVQMGPDATQPVVQPAGNASLRLSSRILLLQQLRNRVELHITRALVDGANLAIAEHLLRDPLPHEAHSAHPLDRLARDSARDLRRVQLRHGGIADKVQAGFLFARGVVDEGAGGADLRVGLRQLVLHALEGADELIELGAVVPDVAGRGGPLLADCGTR